MDFETYKSASWSIDNGSCVEKVIGINPKHHHLRLEVHPEQESKPLHRILHSIKHT